MKDSDLEPPLQGIKGNLHLSAVVSDISRPHVRTVGVRLSENDSLRRAGFSRYLSHSIRSLGYDALFNRPFSTGV